MRALVTGGGGFVGGAVVSALLARGDDVSSVARGAYPDLIARGVTVHRADLASADLTDLTEVLDGVDVVFHVAAKAGIWGSDADFVRSNVTATSSLLAACTRAGTPKLVFTSTPSVVHAGRDIEGADESLPYAATYSEAYPRTKAEAERLVLAANSSSLSTVALRPHLVWGPGDTQLVPRIISRARSGHLRFPGDGKALIDSTFIEDAAAVHLAAADAVGPDASCAGKAYFVSQGEPRPVMDLVNGILAAAGLPPETRTVPLGVALAAGWAAESAWRLLRRADDPPMTRFLARQLATAHWFDTSAVRRDLDWKPARTLDEGLGLLAASLA
jgi:nucleoside-diphosphate-sugar epimerase